MGTELSEGTHVQSLSYERWTSLLGEHFFSPEYKGTHVMYYVDDVCLASLAGMKEADAVASLCDAVRSKVDLGRPRHLFARIGRTTRDWRRAGAEGPPPCLPLLGLAVLAATRMARGRDRAGTNYYLPFSELLAVDVHPDDIYESYGADVPALWKELRWWLDEKHRGALGLSTIEEDSWWTRIGWADSQTLFSWSDRDKLSQFLEWMEYVPGSDVDERELLLYFRRWAAWRNDLSPGTAAMLEDDVFPRQLAEILLHAARKWEGVVRDEEGRLTGELVITFEVAPTPRLGLAARRPTGFPEELTLRSSLGQGLHLHVDDLELPEGEQWYEGLELGLDRSMLESGLTLRSGEYALQLPAYHLHIFHKSKDLGCWASQRLLRPDEPAWLLVRAHTLDRVVTYLRQAGAGDGHMVEREGVAPRGWHLVRDVQLPSDAPQPPEGLSRLKPRTSIRMGLVGGLPLDPGREYLAGGEPDLQLPGRDELDVAEDEVEVEVDGVGYQVREGLLRLRGELSPGPHEVRLEGVPRKFIIRDTLGRIVPMVRDPVVHLIRQSVEACDALTFGAASTPRGASSVSISGATISGAEIAPPKPPVVLPTAAPHVTVVGRRPGQIVRIVPPAAPPWVEQLNRDHPDLLLGFRVFEFEPAFDVVWVLCEYRLGPSLRCRDPLAPDPGVESDPARAHDWIRFFLDVEPPKTSFELWESYRALAKELTR